MHDADGKEATLPQLCRDEPQWAEARIRQLQDELYRVAPFEAKLAETQRALLGLHTRAPGNTAKVAYELLVECGLISVEEEE